MTPQVQIVLATYNGERYIREQIDSILANTVKDISIEICDDGSADQTVKIAREYAEKHACIHVHENEKNLGYVKNFIAGIRRSRSPYLMLCDQDDIWDPDKIARTLAAMKGLEHECGNDVRRPLLIFTDAVNYDSETGKTLGSFHKNSHLNAEKTDPAHLLMENKCIGCGVCTTKCAFDAISLHREHPGCSEMVKSEDKLKYVLPNMIKQSIKLTFAPKK